MTITVSALALRRKSPLVMSTEFVTAYPSTPRPTSVDNVGYRVESWPPGARAEGGAVAYIGLAQPSISMSW